MPYDSTDYITSAATFTDLKSQYSTNEDFKPQPTYSQTTTSNSSWIAVTTTRTEANGDRVQSTSIISKRG